MANRLLRQSKGTMDIGVVDIQGVISIAADASVSSAPIKGVASVARTAAGAYRITLSDSYSSLLACHLQVFAATAVDLVPQLVSETVSSTKIINFKLLTGATATDPAAVCKVHVILKLKDSSV